jgi:hypothetical protein
MMAIDCLSTGKVNVIAATCHQDFDINFENSHNKINATTMTILYINRKFLAVTGVNYSKDELRKHYQVRDTLC